MASGTFTSGFTVQNHYRVASVSARGFETDRLRNQLFYKDDEDHAIADIIIDDSIISYGTITKIKISFKGDSVNDVSGSWDTPTAKVGYVNNSGSDVWVGTYSKAFGKENDYKDISCEISNPIRSNDNNKYKFIIRVTNEQRYTAVLKARVKEISLYIEYTPHTHNWVSTGKTNPTCTSAGSESFKCSICGETKTDTTPAKGHTEVTIPAVAPTCNKTGLTEGKKCSVCNTIITAQQTIPALGHTIDVKSNNDSYGTVTGGGHYDCGATATLTATPKTGYKFVKWSDGVASATRTVTVTADTTYTATFEVNTEIYRSKKKQIVYKSKNGVSKVAIYKSKKKIYG